MKGFVSSRLHPLLALLLLVGLMLAAVCLATFLIAVVASIFFHISVFELGAVTQNPGNNPHGWSVLMLSQGLLLFVGFAGAALALASIQGRSWASYFAPRRPVPAWWLLLAAAIIVLSLPAMSGLIAWNANAQFPAFMHEFEVWARDKETQAQDLTQYLTQFTSTGRLLVGLLVIAVVPAISEELVFRGVVQKQIIRLFGSYHAGVWLSAFLFSAIHMQFFGFVPRLVLGVVLGYLFAWSGNILVPMAAHFAQNAVQILLLYAQQRGTLSATLDPDSTEALPWPWMLLSAVLTLGLLRLAYQKFGYTGAPVVSHTLTGEGLLVGGSTPPLGHTLTSHGVEPAPRPQAPL
ncbi:CPBP family intramembrane metalloprotease [Hymenobacter lutimineralis]|uniref:CPBP family intramembrane metalloprotease n=1 Tax=Hymenobacter lutimineralis TaxID=2606448 RepID=A0A5D6UYK0_9BACT|nr:CPBP family intramembrane glutamic endopeptidase [Hymenobacter lutimineralis]TYZ08851.1 CPBP family intramembrane metalloprotease [Hymenobacter lutimineralis]